MNKVYQIAVTLNGFRAMGASTVDLIKEAARLSTDEQYLWSWYATVVGDEDVSFSEENKEKSAG